MNGPSIPLTPKLSLFDFDSFRYSIIRNFFPFTLSQAKYREVPDKTLLAYELSMIRLAKKIEEISKALATKENKEPNEEYMRKVLKEIKKLK